MPAHTPLRNVPQDIPDLAQRRQNIGVVDALTSGLVDAARRPWLIVIPFVLDLFIWLAPPLSVKTIVDRLMIIWEALVRGSYSTDQLSGMGDMITSVREMAAQVGSEVNLFHYLTGSWPGVPSALVAPQKRPPDVHQRHRFRPGGHGAAIETGRPGAVAGATAGSEQRLAGAIAGSRVVADRAGCCHAIPAPGRDPPEARRRRNA